MEIITKTQLAGELKISRARVSQLVKKGMPCRSDGKVDRTRALAWVAHNLSSLGGGWLVRGKGVSIAEAARQALIEAPVTETGGELTAGLSANQLYAHIRTCFAKLPEFLVSAGIPVPESLAAAEITDALVGAALLTLDDRLIDDDQSPLPEPDWKSLAAAAGVRLNHRAVLKRADKIVDIFAAKWDCGERSGDQVLVDHKSPEELLQLEVKLW